MAPTLVTLITRRLEEDVSNTGFNNQELSQPVPQCEKSTGTCYLKNYYSMSEERTRYKERDQVLNTEWKGLTAPSNQNNCNNVPTSGPRQDKNKAGDADSSSSSAHSSSDRQSGKRYSLSTTCHNSSQRYCCTTSPIV